MEEWKKACKTFKSSKKLGCYKEYELNDLIKEEYWLDEPTKRSLTKD